MAEVAGVDGRGLSFGVLGPLEVTRCGERLRLGGHQQRAVLALLLAESGSVVSVGRLGDALWGHQTPSGFVTTLQTYVYHLREVLEPDRAHGARGKVLVTEPGGYRLDTADSMVDCAVFEDYLQTGRDALGRHAYEEASAELTRGLRLWRGEAFAEVADLGFAEPVAVRLETMRMIAQSLRIEAELALGRHSAVLPEIDRLVAQNPLQEQLHVQKMMALYRLGRQSDALAAYRAVRSRLHHELGIEPTQHLQQVHQAVLAQDPVLDWQPQRATGSGNQASGNGLAAIPGATQQGVEISSPPMAGQEGSVAALAGPDHARRSGHLVRSGHPAQVASAALAVLLTAGLLGLLIARWTHHVPSSFPANSVGSINHDGTPADSVTVGLGPDGLAFGAGSLWAANRADGTVSRISPDTHQVLQTIAVGASPNEVTVTGNDVWVANFGDGTVSRISASTNTQVERVVVGGQPVAIANGPSGVWVANRGDDTIQRIDPVTGRADRAIVVSDSPSGLALDATTIWVCSDTEGTVTEFDLKATHPGKPVMLQSGRSIAVPGGPRGIALTREDVWVASKLSQSVTRVNRSTGATQTFTVGDGPHSLQVAGDGAVWVSDEYDGTIARIDPSSNEVSKWSVGASPRGLAEAGGVIWVASGPFADAGHQGGTLRVVGDTIPGGSGVIDPAAVYDRTTQPAERFVYDGLVALGMSDGAPSQTLVPDLAVGLPSPSNAGRTYAFTLRHGLRYSTGREVHASDFRTGLLKALTLRGNPEQFAGVVGGRSCIDRPSSCDLSAGLVTDDATRRVTFNLVAPDALFLDKLANLVYPVPPGTPTVLSKVPVPGTGPYMISGYAPGTRFTLARNPYFHQWSFAAQPGGYPDVIDFRKLPAAQAPAEVLAGRADVADFSSTASVREDLARRYPAQFKEQLLAQTGFEYLNTRIPPFDDLRVRRALNFAVDRTRLVDVMGATARNSLTCQVLPPNLPGYRWYCPFTQGSPTSGYHGPDLVKARELVRLSGTRGMAVTIRGESGSHQLDLYLASVLRQLGYSVRVREAPQPAFNDLLKTDKEAQLAAGPGWIAHYPAASSFFDQLSSCTSAAGGPGWYCNKRVERTVVAARAAELSDPAEAGRLWTAVDQQLTDDAPFVALGNLTGSYLVSTRAGNYQSNPWVGPLLSQIWVR